MKSLCFALIVIHALSGTSVLAQAWPPWAEDAFSSSPRYPRTFSSPPFASPPLKQALPRDDVVRRPRPLNRAIQDGGARPEIAPQAPPVVAFSYNFVANSIVIDLRARTLYYVLDNQQAYAYPIGIGREGFSWNGTETVSRKQAWPDWYPPPEMRERDPSLPERMTGGLRNPLGAMALYLGNSLYRIHGTNDAKSIGRAESSGCFRMLNSQVLHLAALTQIGTPVKVTPSLEVSDQVSQSPVPVGAPKSSSMSADYRSLREELLHGPAPPGRR